MAAKNVFLVVVATMAVVAVFAMAEETAGGGRNSWKKYTDLNYRAFDGAESHGFTQNNYFAAEANQISKKLLRDTRGMQPQITPRKMFDWDDCKEYYCDGNASCDYLLGLDCECNTSKFSCYHNGGFKPRENATPDQLTS